MITKHIIFKSNNNTATVIFSDTNNIKVLLKYMLMKLTGVENIHYGYKYQ